MKRFELFFVVTLVLLQSCGQSEARKREIRVNAVRDSITTVRLIENKKEQAKKDSIIHFEQGKVIGDILFGITKKEFDKKENYFRKKCEVIDWVSGGYTSYKYKIGDYKFSQIWGDYYNEKLYFVQIIGDPIHYEDYKSRMKDQAVAIYQVFNNKYGVPNEDIGIPEWHRTEKGYSYLVSNWIVGTKKIELRVQNDGIYYHLNINIYQPEISTRIEGERKAKEKVAAAKATDLL